MAEKTIQHCCRRCGAEFVGTKKAMYCEACRPIIRGKQSRAIYEKRRDQARAERAKEMRCCGMCGKPLPVDARHNKRYCDGCAAERRRVASRAYNDMVKKARERRSRYMIVCADCGTVFEAASPRAKFCDCCRNRKQRNLSVEAVGRRDGRECYKRKCDTCGLLFVTLDADRTRCVDCVKGRVPGKKSQTNAPAPVLSLAEQMRIIAEYNREHGTDYQYGEFDTVQRLSRGEFRVDVKL